MDSRHLLSFVTLATLVCSLLIGSSTDMGAAAESLTDEFGCPQSAPALAGLSFNDTQHRLWYLRFWTGVCDGLPMFSCFPGRPFWTETMRRILQKLPETSRNNAQIRMCALGKLVGFEWAKDNNIRKIDTQLVSRWIDRLDAAEDPFTELAAIDTEAKEKLAHR
jgi:hypothetical protein